MVHGILHGTWDVGLALAVQGEVHCIYASAPSKASREECTYPLPYHNLPYLPSRTHTHIVFFSFPPPNHYVIPIGIPTSTQPSAPILLLLLRAPAYPRHSLLLRVLVYHLSPPPTKSLKRASSSHHNASILVRENNGTFPEILNHHLRTLRVLSQGTPLINHKTRP